MSVKQFINDCCLLSTKLKISYSDEWFPDRPPYSLSPRWSQWGMYYAGHIYEDGVIYNEHLRLSFHLHTGTDKINITPELVVKLMMEQS